MCRVPEKSRWNTWHLWLDGGQFLIINRSFIEEKFEKRRRNVKKEASNYHVLIPCQNIRPCACIVQFHPHS